MTLGEYIFILSQYPYRDKIALFGLSEPYAWRDDINILAFEPVKDISVGEMVDVAKSCIGQVFDGYHGGCVTVTEDTEITIEYEGEVTMGATTKEFIKAYRPNTDTDGRTTEWLMEEAVKNMLKSDDRYIAKHYNIAYYNLEDS